MVIFEVLRCLRVKVFTIKIKIFAAVQNRKFGNFTDISDSIGFVHMPWTAGPYAVGCERIPLAVQIISKSCNFSPETEFAPLILALKSEFS